jgi:hypothetical protein
MLSGTVKAGDGFNPATVPFCAVRLLERPGVCVVCCDWKYDWPPELAGVGVPLFRESSDSIFRRRVCQGLGQ